jgi:hypothetical protein
MPDIIAPFKAIDLNDFDDYLQQLVDRAKGAAQRAKRMWSIQAELEELCASF